MPDTTSQEEQQEFVVCGPNFNYHTTCDSSAGTINSGGIDCAWSLKEFKEGLTIQIVKLQDDKIEFDVVGMDPSLANAFRRIMIAEVPTIAIEHVYYIDNTSVIGDEVLAHRLGLVPIHADPRRFVDKKEEDPANEKNTVVFKLEVPCEKGSETSKAKEKKVLSSDLVWLPNGSEMPEETNCSFMNGQQEFSGPDSIKPCFDDIVLAKLRPGQAIQLEAHCCRGIGREHAKWSPVATAWYRLQPEVILLKDVCGDDAEVLASELPGLIVVGEEGGEKQAKVTEARGKEKLLEKVRRLSGEERWKDALQLRKRKRHFIFTVESVGQYKAHEIFSEAVDVLIGKCDRLLASL